MWLTHSFSPQAIKTKLQQQVSELKGKVGDLDRLKRDNLELKNQVQGQHSIISGLRKERDLWSKELAQQGISITSTEGGRRKDDSTAIIAVDCWCCRCSPLQ